MSVLRVFHYGDMVVLRRDRQFVCTIEPEFLTDTELAERIKWELVTAGLSPDGAMVASLVEKVRSGRDG